MPKKLWELTTILRWCRFVKKYICATVNLISEGIWNKAIKRGFKMINMVNHNYSNLPSYSGLFRLSKSQLKLRKLSRNTMVKSKQLRCTFLKVMVSCCLAVIWRFNLVWFLFMSIPFNVTKMYASKIQRSGKSKMYKFKFELTTVQ